MTKQLALSLSTNGFEVSVMVPKKLVSKNDFDNQFKILPISILNSFNPFTYKKINADIYHSQNQNLISLMAMIFEKKKKHIITVRDPRTFKDWVTEFKYASWKRRIKIPLNYFFEEGVVGKLAVRKADVVGCPAYFLKDKVERLYGLKKKPILFPNIENIPDIIPDKSVKPLVCFVGRLEGVKRPYAFIDLAQKFPNVDFVMVGKAESGNEQEKLQKVAKKSGNIKIVGFIDKFSSSKLYDIYDKSWIIVNTSAKEGLPVTFVEAAGRGCAILSGLNPDGFATKFGYWAKNDNFEEGLKYLLEGNNWAKAGKRAHEYVYSIYRADKAIENHVALYNRILT